MPLSFKLNEVENATTKNPTFSWHKSVSLRNKPITYSFYLSTDFLFKDTTKTVIIKNLKDTFYTVTKPLNLGKYFWKVESSDGELTTEGFNTKNILFIKNPTVLPEKISTTMILDESKSPYLITKNITIEKEGKLIIQKGVDLLFSRRKRHLCSRSNCFRRNKR
jgi:hypothetical protein